MLRHSRNICLIIVNAFNPWLSTADIDKGARWSSDLATALATAKAGIICLTPNNLDTPYILFESGALSKTVGKPFVCTLLIGMEPSDVSGPLAQFQATKPTKEDLLQLLNTLNNALGDSAIKDSQIQATFELVWPRLKERLDNLPSDGPAGRPHRSDRELLEELVDSVRSTSAQTNALLKQLVEGIANLWLRLSSADVSVSPDTTVSPLNLQRLALELGLGKNIFDERREELAKVLRQKTWESLAEKLGGQEKSPNQRKEELAKLLNEYQHELDELAAKAEPQKTEKKPKTRF